MTYGTETKWHATETNWDSRYPVTYTVEEHCEHATPQTHSPRSTIAGVAANGGYAAASDTGENTANCT